MVLAMPKKITLEDLARMVQEGFVHIEAKFEKRFVAIETRLDRIEERLDNIETRLNRIEYSILTSYRDRIERLEDKIFGKFGR